MCAMDWKHPDTPIAMAGNSESKFNKKKKKKKKKLIF